MKAYELIEKYGWIQGSYGNKQVGFCLLGALSKARNWTHGHCWDNAVSKLKTRLNVKELVKWNDRKSRRKSHVIKLLKELNL